jgi:hypothetical protein
MIHSSTLGFSPRLPVSVYGTGFYNLKLSGFSWKSGYLGYPLTRRLRVLSAFSKGRVLYNVLYTYGLNELFRQFAPVSLLRHRVAVIKSTGILTSCPSATPFGFTLGPD